MIELKDSWDIAATSQSKDTFVFNQSAACEISRVFPRLARGACFPALGAGCIFFLLRWLAHCVVGICCGGITLVFHWQLLPKPFYLRKFGQWPFQRFFYLWRRATDIFKIWVNYSLHLLTQDLLTQDSLTQNIKCIFNDLQLYILLSLFNSWCLLGDGPFLKTYKLVN